MRLAKQASLNSKGKWLLNSGYRGPKRERKKQPRHGSKKMLRKYGAGSASLPSDPNTIVNEQFESKRVNIFSHKYIIITITHENDIHSVSPQ